MKLIEFSSFRKNCIVCNAKTSTTMIGTMTEVVGNETIHSIFNYKIPIFRKDFFTFAVASSGVFAASDLFDIDTLNQDKYKSFIINKDGYVSFDIDFNFKMRLNMRGACPNNHYAYISRNIVVSRISPDITKGYPIIVEDLSYGKYKVISNIVDKTTSIFNINEEKEPIIIPYMDVISFPVDSIDKFEKKIENILLLA